MKYKHYSFDLWMTLIKSNPMFKRARAEYFQDHFNRKKKSIKEIEAIFREVDLMCNWTNETVGGSIDALEMYSMVLHKIDYDLEPLSLRDLQSIYHTVESIFFKYEPVLFDGSTREVLDRLNKNGATLSILSNTGFIQGHTLRKVLSRLEVSKLLNFQIYSDEVGCSKPMATIFTLLTQGVSQIRVHDPVQFSEIVHIGDNLYADGGAKKVGLDTIIINSDGVSIRNIS